MQNPLAMSGVSPPLRLVINLLTRMDVLRDVYGDWLLSPTKGTADGPAFLNFVLKKLKADIKVSNPQLLSDIPAEGPLLVVANHPLGAMEGMLLSQLLLTYRPDLKILTNELLLRIPEFNGLFIGVDVLNTNAEAKNLRGMRAANRHLANGGALLVFPAGTVAKLNLVTGKVADFPWSTIVGRLALKHKANCLPLHVNSRNSTLFYLAGYINKRLRTALLPRAMLNKRNSLLPVAIGPVIHNDYLAELGSASVVTQYLRVCCDLLGSSDYTPGDTVTAATSVTQTASESSNLTSQLESLRQYQMAELGSYSVYCAPYHELGVLKELLAESREITFRMAGEGTGKVRDQDRFDEYYWHVLAWDHANNRLIGGYRVIRVDAALQKYGVKGLYSNSLFHYDRKFLDAMGPAIEVGRSFITAPYQRDPAALDLLWKGIGAFVRKNRDCHTLFGCVSISTSYSPIARTLLSDTLLQHHTVDASIRKMVRPVKSRRTEQRTWDKELPTAIANIAIFNKLLGKIGADKSVPTLIRHYLSINGKFIEFAVNQGFNKSLDGLILVDLRQTPNKYLRRYLGDEAATEILSYWRNH